MKGSRFSEEQIIGVLREEAGVKTEEVCAGGTGSRARFLQVEIEVRRAGARPNPALGTGGQSRWAAPLLDCQAAILSTILPRSCGAPPSISWAIRASSNRSTVPTSVTSLPLSNSSVTLFSRAVVTST